LDAPEAAGGVDGIVGDEALSGCGRGGRRRRPQWWHHPEPPAGLEPTSGEVEVRRSVRLSYGGQTWLHSATALSRHSVWSRMQDSNPRRLLTRQELFPVELIRPANPAVMKHQAAQWNRLDQAWCAGRGSNPRPSRYKRAAHTTRAPGALQNLWCPRRDSNPHQSGFRRPALCPLSYAGHAAIGCPTRLVPLERIELPSTAS
jgi:hypothetical protein